MDRGALGDNGTARLEEGGQEGIQGLHSSSFLLELLDHASFPALRQDLREINPWRKKYNKPDTPSLVDFGVGSS